MHELTMLILYGAMFAAVILTFLRWGGVDDVSYRVDDRRAHGSCVPRVEKLTEIAPTVDADALLNVEAEYAEAN